MSTSKKMLIALLLLVNMQQDEAVLCYDCHSEMGTCNDGECDGAVCIKMETSNRNDERRTVQKGCSDDYEENGCEQSAVGSKWTSRCVCDRTLCNGDSALIAAGLEPSSGTPSTTTTPAIRFTLITLIMFSFVASCSLIVINIVCIHLS